MLSARSVSYTHLDVYKRQFLNWVQKTKPHIKSETGLLLFVPTIKLTVYLRIPCRIFINSLYNTESVSYTHLDVYKRQPSPPA